MQAVRLEFIPFLGNQPTYN